MELKNRRMDQRLQLSPARIVYGCGEARDLTTHRLSRSTVMAVGRLARDSQKRCAAATGRQKILVWNACVEPYVNFCGSLTGSHLSENGVSGLAYPDKRHGEMYLNGWFNHASQVLVAEGARTCFKELTQSARRRHKNAITSKLSGLTTAYAQAMGINKYPDDHEASVSMRSRCRHRRETMTQPWKIRKRRFPF